MICNTAELRHAVATLAPMTASDGFLRVLTNLHFRIESERLLISASDSESLATIAIGFQHEAKYPLTESFLIPGKAFSALLKNVTSDTVTFRDYGTAIRFAHAKSYVSYTKSSDVAAFIFDRDRNYQPQRPLVDITVPAEELRRGIALCAPCCSTDATQPRFNGVAFIGKGDTLCLEASDRTLLARYTILLEGEMSFVFVVPMSHVRALVRGANADEQVSLSVYSGQCRVQTSACLLFAPLINVDSWPNTEAVFATQHNWIAQFNETLEEFSASIVRCGFALDTVTPDVELTISATRCPTCEGVGWTATADSQGVAQQTACQTCLRTGVVCLPVLTTHGENVSGEESLQPVVIGPEVPPPLDGKYVHVSYSHATLLTLLKAFTGSGDVLSGLYISATPNRLLHVVGTRSQLCLVAQRVQ